MSSFYNSLTDPSTNLLRILKEQNSAGALFSEFEGSEPFEVLIAKVVYNAANSGGALGQVLAVNGRTGTVTLDKSDVGLSAVPNLDTSNAGNITSGSLSA